MRQNSHIVAPFAQRRQRNLEHVETEIEILTESAGSSLVGKLLVGGCQHSYVDLAILDVAHAPDLAGLDGAEQFGLTAFR